MIIVIIVFFVSVSGLGFGILSGAFSTVNVLADMVGPGTIGIYGDSKYFFVATGNCSVTKFYICVVWTKCTLPFPHAFQYLLYKCLKIIEHLNLPVAVKLKIPLRTAYECRLDNPSSYEIKEIYG